MSPDERDYEIARLLHTTPKRDSWVVPRDVVCEPCAADNHRDCVRPCTCTLRPEKDTP